MCIYMPTRGIINKHLCTDRFNMFEEDICMFFFQSTGRVCLGAILVPGWVKVKMCINDVIGMFGEILVMVIYWLNHSKIVI